MKKAIVKQNKKIRRKNKIRMKIKGTSGRPRLSVFKSNKGMFMQLIDDDKGVTLASANAKEIKVKGKKSEISYELGKLIAKKGQEKKISEVVFDRGGNKYHGRIEMAAQGARDGGLKF
jgi:large subunit ribosomal protein L18